MVPPSTDAVLAFYLDHLLTEAELTEVEHAVGEPVECVRIPWLFPLRGDAAEDPAPTPDRVRPHLVRAGVHQAAGGRCLLVAPRQVHWYASLAQAIREETGAFPLLVQPEVRRAEVGVPGPLRVLDMEAWIMDEDAGRPPPWLTEDP